MGIECARPNRQPEFAGLLICLVLSLQGCGEEPKPFETGDTLPNLKLTGHLDVPLRRGDWWLVTYYAEDSSAMVSRAGYIDRLLKRFEGHNLQSAAIIAPNASRLIKQLNASGVSYPVLIDQEGTSAKILHFDGDEDQVWFIDPKGVIRFTSFGKRVEDDDLRQLAEKLILGQVSRYDPDKRRWMEKGDQFPQTALYDLSQTRWRSPKEVNDRFDRFVVFTADCTACSLASYLNRFKTSIRSLAQDGRRVAGIFSSRFSRAEVIDEATNQSIAAPLFLAQEEIQGIEDGYYLQSLIAKVVVIDTDDRGFVEEVQPFDGLEAQLGGSGVP